MRWKLFSTTSAKRAGHKKSRQRLLYWPLSALLCHCFVRYLCVVHPK
nr:MAG TPA: hypothetical protein [Bacteriophage sp.]